MIGSAMSFAGYALVLLLLSIWMVVKVWKKSVLLAILCFFFSPLFIVALFMNWGDEESDIRTPFFLSVLVTALMIFMAYRTVDKGIAEMAYSLTDEDIAEVRASDPDMASQLLKARNEQRAARGEPLNDDEFFADDDSALDDGADGIEAVGVERDPNTRPAASAPRDPAVLDAEHRGSTERAASLIGWQFRRVALPAANATLELPERFRFAPRANLTYFARLNFAALPKDVLGWAVYRDVNLAREDAWYVQLRYVPVAKPPALPQAFGDVAARDAALAAYVGQLAVALGGDALAVQSPTWDAAAGIATWQRGGGSDAVAGAYADYVAVRVVPGGVLEFTVPGLHVAQGELGLRAARLIASRVNVGGAEAGRAKVAGTAR